MRTCPKCQGMMLPERVIDMLDGLVGHFYACVNCARREDAEEGVRCLCEGRQSRALVAGH
jgi:DNA-directed RNA polymerase subunit M/transcription elongation factor TFIIS